MSSIGAAEHNQTPHATHLHARQIPLDNTWSAGSADAVLDVAGLPAVLDDPVFDGHPSPTTPAPPSTALARSAVAGGIPASGAVASAADRGAPERDWVGVREWVVGFLLGQRSGHTRRAYAGDLQGFLGWCVQAGVAPGRACRADLDRYARTLELVPSEKTGRVLSRATVARRLATLAGFYRYAAVELGLASSPAAHLARPRAGREVTLGPSRVEVASLLAAAEADSSRAAALVSLLVHTGLRIDEALSRDVADWRVDAGHEVLRLERKGGREGVTVLPAPVVRALRAYLAGRATGPLFITGSGGRMDQPAAWRLCRRLAVAAGIDDPERVSPHALRHAFVTLALDAGASLRDVQDAARGLLDRHPAYAVGAHLAAATTVTCWPPPPPSHVGRRHHRHMTAARSPTANHT